MALPIYASPLQKTWYYIFRIITIIGKTKKKKKKDKDKKNKVHRREKNEEL